MTSSTMEDPYYPSLYSCSPRGGPPPIPSVPPPEGSHIDGYGQLQSIHTRYADSPSHANYVALDTGMCCVFPRKIVKGESEPITEKKKTSTLGRLFRNMGFRRSSRKHSYKKHQGDLLAHEITMGDNDRIALMQMVKEGKISTETALQVVKKFEEERKKDEPPHSTEHGKEKEKKSTGKTKKSSSLKPTKSPSIYSESQCDVCNNLSVNNYPSTFTGGHQCLDFQDQGCRHRRVHSVSHIAYPEHLRSPGTARAMSCSPMRSHSTQNSAVNSPVGYGSVNQAAKIYTPVIPHELKMYSGSRGLYGVHGIDMIRDRLNVIKTSTCVHKTQSKASLISSESDHSMECLSHLGNQGEQQTEEMYFPSNNSTVSVGSDTLPAMNGRRKCGNAMEKIRNHKWQRTGSVSQGEDGMSTDTDELDDPDRLLLGGGTASSSHMMEKFRGVRNEMRRRILHTRDIIGDGKSQHLCSAYQTAPGINQSVSSTDSCSSGIGSQSGGQIWTDLDVQGQGQMAGPILGIARVTSNYTPSQGEKDFLHLKRGERVHVLEATSGGIWKGQIDNRVGFFHFNFVDMITENTPTNHRKDKTRRRMNRRSKPQTVEELLQRIGLEHLTPIFLMNGYDNLEIFAEIDHEDLNALNILDSESRTKLITAAELLTDYNDGPQEPPMRSSRSASATPTSQQQYAVPWTSFFPSSKPSTGSRDSGCYDSNEFMNRENDPYASACRIRAVTDKENLRPNGGKKLLVAQQTVPGTNIEFNLNGAKVQNGAKEEKIYSEEDQEVCHITGFQNSKGSRSSPRQPTLVNGRDSASSDVHSNYRSLNIPVLGPDWKVFSDSYSQTSPYGSMSDSFHTSADETIVAPGSAMSASVHGDIFSQNISTISRKTKPYARKISPSVPMKDAQVQVMCPLGLFPLQSPCSPTLVSTSVTQSTVETVNQSQTGPQQSFNLELTRQSGLQLIPDTSLPTRVSYTSQNSRDGDSGSDASTVKSDKIGSGPEHGRSTPDSLYGPIHKSFKSIKRSVIPKVTSKLASENIDLAGEPYSSPIAAEQLTEQSLATSELKIATIPEFFISIGLPMYAEPFCMKGYTSVEAISNLPVKEIQSISKADRKHLKRIIHALEWVQNRLKSPSRKVKSSPVKDKV
ncbi:SAM and SH3 domain-containing protein 1-like isoform X2 [Ruditapes philippinarum]|uniref:SAM and SH3 domain-containing protein 1-like isoform X2 n=1 Tax=Ruditapes philippinarum TaxID=129788 RepID=UPI00295B45D5|nr:SAM and SH3 domain-containing protein 1-like isoform X2 [Ruditapes philippinarum]